IVEQLAIDRAKQLFGADYANVQPHAGSQANAAVYLALLSAGDTILGMSLAGLVVAALGLLVVWLVGYGIARPLRQLVGMLDDIAQGEGDLTRRLS
ncbi:hypothetical protein Q4R52_20630, partial [Morganella morganii]